MGSQCCKCAKGKDERQSRPTSINIRFHGSQEISTFRYKLRPYENIDRYKSKPSRSYYTGYHPRITEILDNHNSPTDNVRPVRRRIKSMNSNGISGVPQEGDPPIFIRKLTDLAVKVGTRTRFLVEIQSSSCPQVTWHRNHEPVQAGSRFSFVHEGNFYCIDVAPVTVDDEGYWTCTAENIAGRSSCTCCLNIIIPKAYKKPHFLEELRAILTESGNVSLECKVLGVPTPVLKWFKDEKEMKAGDIFALTALSDDPTSLGIYRCEAVNCMGIASSSSKVHVIGSEGGDKSVVSIKSSGPLPVFKKLLKNEACRIGENLTLSCQIQVPPWPKDVAWYNDSGRIESNEKYHIMEDGLGVYSIEIHGLEAVDKGEWKCVATSMENVKQFTTSRVSMVIPRNYRIPRFMEDLRAILTEEGLVSFECKVVGFPTPVLKWFKDGEELKPGDVYQLTGTNSLGSYCCIAKNCMGEARSTAELTIEDIEQQLNEEERLQLKKEFTQVPKFKIGLKCCEATINEHFTFAVRLDVTISPEPSVSWYRNDELIIEDAKYKLVTETLGNFHLEIKNLELIDQAQWKCLAENDFGHSVTSCFLKLIIPRHFKKPKYLENLRAILSEDGTVSLECKVIGVPQPVLKWYKDGIELKPGDIHRIISGENGTCCLGTYTCEATNCMGSVSSSAALLGFEDDPKQVQNEETQQLPSSPKNISLSTIHEERTSQLYDTPQTDYSVTLDDHGEVSFSLDGKEVSVSLYETPDLTEEDAIQIVEMYADQLSEHITEGDVIELPPMRFTKETSTSGNLLMEAVVIDVSPDYFISNEHFEDLRTEMDVEDVSIMDDQTQSNISSYSSAMGQTPSRPLRKRQRSEESSSSKSDHSEKSHRKSIRTLSEDYHSAQEPSSMEGQFSLAIENISPDASHDAVSFPNFSGRNSPKSNDRNTNMSQDRLLQSQYFTERDADDKKHNVPDNEAFESTLEVMNQQSHAMNIQDPRRITAAISDLEQTVQNFLLMQEESDDPGMFIIAEKLEIIHQSLQPFISTVPSDESYGILENYIDELVLGMLTEPLEDLAQITRRFYTLQITDGLLNDFEKVIMNFKLKLETLVVALETYENESSRAGITETHRQLSRHLHSIMNDIFETLLKGSLGNLMKSGIHGAAPDDYESERGIFKNNQVESTGTIEDLPLIFSSIHFGLSSALEKASASTFDDVSEMKIQNERLAVYSSTSPLINDIENLRQCIGDITMTLATPMTSGNYYDLALNEFEKLRVPLSHLQEDLLTREYQPEEACILKNIMTPIQNLKKAIVNVAQEHLSELEIMRLLETIERHASLAAVSSSNETLIEGFEETDRILQPLKLAEGEGEKYNATMDVHRVPDVNRAEQLDLWILTTLEPLDRLANAALSLDRSISEEAHMLLCKPLDSLYKQIDLMKCQINRSATQSLENDVETIIEGFLWPLDQLRNAISMSVEIWREKPAEAAVRQHLEELGDSVSDLCEQLTISQENIVRVPDRFYDDQKTDASLVETITAVVGPLQDIRETITMMLNTIAFENVDESSSIPLLSGEMALGSPVDTGRRIEHDDVETLNEGFDEEPIQAVSNVDNVQYSLQSEQVSNDGLSCPLNTTSMKRESSGESAQGNMRCIDEEETCRIADDELMKTTGGEIQKEEFPANFSQKILGESETKDLKKESEFKEQIMETGTLHELLEDSPISNKAMMDGSNNAVGQSLIPSDAIQPTGEEIPEYFQVPLENVPHIIEDELNRQDALVYASTNFIELVQEKINMVISRSSNIDQQSIFEEMVRDITVEELQSIKSYEHTVVDDKIDDQFISGVKSNDDSIQPVQYQEFGEGNELKTVKAHYAHYASTNTSIGNEVSRDMPENMRGINEEELHGMTHDTSIATMMGEEQSEEFLQDSAEKVIEMPELVGSSENNRDLKEQNKTLIVHDLLEDSLIPNEPKLNDSPKGAPRQELISSDVAHNPNAVEYEAHEDSQVSLESIPHIIEDELDRQGAIEYASIDFIKLVEEKVYAAISKSSLVSQQSILEEMIRDVTVEELQSIKSNKEAVPENDIHNQQILSHEQKGDDGSLKQLQYQEFCEVGQLEYMRPDGHASEKIVEDSDYNSSHISIDNEIFRNSALESISSANGEKPHGMAQDREVLSDFESRIFEESRTIGYFEEENNSEEPINKTVTCYEKLKDSPIPSDAIIHDLSNNTLEQTLSSPEDIQTTALETLEHAQNNLAVKNEDLKDSQVSLESIPYIIKDELHRQDALEYASIDFINHVQEKVYAAVSESFHIDQQSILEELVRDITLEELQSIKSDEHVVEDHIDNQSLLLLEQKSDDDSIQSSQDKKFCEANQSEKMKPENMHLINAEVCHEMVETSEPIPRVDKSDDFGVSSNKALVHETLDDSPTLIEPTMDDSLHNVLERVMTSPDVDQVPIDVHISLESIPHIIEDELNRQGALECASINFINLVQEKVYATLLKSSNIDQQSIFEEMIRDLTVEELQSIKSVEKEGRFHSEIRPVEIPMGDSNGNEIKELVTLESGYTTGNLIQSEGHEEIIKSKDHEGILNYPLISDSQDSAETIEELSPREAETEIMNVAGTSDHDELKNISAAKTVIDTSLNEAVEPLMISDLESVSPSIIEQEKHIDPVQQIVESTVLHSPISSIQSAPEECIDNLSIAESQEQKSKIVEDDIPMTLKEQTQLINIAQSRDHDELKKINATETGIDTSLNEAVEPLVISDLESVSASIIEQEKHIDRVQQIVESTVLHSPISSIQSTPEECTDNLSITESQEQKSKIIEDDIPIKLKEQTQLINIAQSHDHDELKNISSSQTAVDISLDEAIEPLAISEHESVSTITIEQEKYVDPVKPVTQSAILQSPISSTQYSPEESTQDLEIAELQKHTPVVVEDDSSVTLKEEFRRKVFDAKRDIMILRRPSTMEIETPWEKPDDAVNSEALDQRMVAPNSDRIISIGSPLLSHCQMSDQPLEGLSPLESEPQIMDVAESCHHDEFKNISPTKSVIDISLEEAIEPLVTSNLESVSARTIEEEKHIDPVKPTVQSTILQSPMSSTQCTTEESTQDLVIAELQEEKPKVLEDDSTMSLQEKSTISVSDLKTDVMVLRRPSTVELETQWEIPKDAVNSEELDQAITASSVDDIMQPAAQNKHVIYNYPQVLDEIFSNEDARDIVENTPVSHNVEAVDIDPLVKATEHEANVRVLQSKVVNNDDQNLDDKDLGGRIINLKDDTSIELGKTELIPELMKNDVGKPSGEVLKSSEDEVFEDQDERHLETNLLGGEQASESMETASKPSIISDSMQADNNKGKEHHTDNRKSHKIKKEEAMQTKESPHSPKISEDWIREIILTEVNNEESESVLGKTDIDDLVMDVHRQTREKLKELHSEDAMRYVKKIVVERLHDLMIMETARTSEKSHQENESIIQHINDSEICNEDTMDVMEFHGSEMKKVRKSSLKKYDEKGMKDGAKEHSEEAIKGRKKSDVLHPQPEDGSYPKESKERRRARKHEDDSGKSSEGQSGVNKTGDSQSSKVMDRKLELDISEQRIVASASTADDKYSKEQVVESIDNSMKNENQLNVEDTKLIGKSEDKVKKGVTISSDPAEEPYENKFMRKDGSDLMGKKNYDDSNVTDDQGLDKVDTSSSYNDETWRKRHEKQVDEHDSSKEKNETKRVRSDHQKLPSDPEISDEREKRTGYVHEEEIRLKQTNRPRSLKKNDERNKSKSTRYAFDIESPAEDSNSELAFMENNLSMGSESSDSLRFNTTAGQLRERETVGNLPSISIDSDELMTHDHSRYSDLSSRTFQKYQRSDISSVSTYREYSPVPKQKGKKPVFCMKLIDRTAAASSRIKLTCTVLGDPDPSVIWMHSGRELFQSSNRYCMINDNGVVSLEIYSVKPKDSGEYACVARNIHGEASTAAKLKVYAGYESTPSLPIFTRSIKDTFKLDEGKLILECRVRAQPSPTVTWLKDGKIIEMNNRYRQSDLAEGICRLQISNPCDKDNGMYTCRAENQSGFGECTSHFINYENAGKIKCEVTAMRTYQKRHILTSEMHSTVDHDIHSYILSDLWESDRSMYTYRPDHGHIESHPKFDGGYFYTRENGKPAVFISRPVDKLIHACGGEDVSLSFRVGGVPKPKVILMKGLVDITNGSRAYKESHDDYVRITFKRIELSDEGTYCILVKNRYGYDRCFFTIRVKQRARSLTPARSTEWNFENVKDYLSHIHEPTQSQYKFVPGPISSEPVVVDGGKTWLALSWGKADQRGPAPVVAYRVDAWLIGGDGGARWVELGVTSTNSFDAFNLCPGEEYKFRITPRNRYGWGESVTMTNPVTVKEIIKFPEFSKILPGQLKALKGTTLNLNCEISSKSVTHIRWYKDSTELDVTHDPRFLINNIDSKCSLSIVDITETDSGRYVCDATNVAGRVSTFARVQVVTDPKIADADLKLRRMRTIDSSSEERPPEFTMRLRDRRVQATYPVRLTCQVDGHPEPKITWYKYEEKINPEVENMTISKDEAHFHTLEISRSKIDNTGIYMVRAQNPYGSLSCRCHLVVDEGIRAYIAPEFSRQLDSVYTVVQNEELRMTAQVEAYPAVGITWYRDGKRLRPDRNTVMSLNHDGTIELALAHISCKNAGLYCCIAANEVGRAESKAKVQVSINNEDIESFIESSIEVGQSSNVPYSKEPVFITKPLSTEAFEGDNIIIVCEVIGDPKPDVIWLRDFLRPDYYKDAPHFRPVGLGPQYRLEIPYAKLDFTGTYSVIAKNCFGEAKAVISLQIYARDPERQEIGRKQTVKHSEVQTLPIIKSPLKNIRCCDGDAVTFICNIDATPPPDIRWEKGGKLVPLQGDVSFDFEGETARLHIEHVYPEDEGEYICIAYNDLGSAYTSACLIVDVPEGKEISLNRRLKKPISLLSPNATPISTPRSTPIRSLSPSCVRREFKHKSGQRPRMPAAPKFYSVPHNRVAEEGDTIRFQCAVAGHPTPWSNWDKDGITVTSTARVTIREKEDLRILEITQVTYEDAGLYRITLENDIGRVEATARLEIIRGKHESISRGVMQTSRQIRAASDRPQNHTSLSYDSHFSSSTLLDRFTGRDTNNPTYFSHHREEFPNEGAYEESFDSDELVQPPVILSSPADVIAVKGDNVVLLTTYSGYPEPTVQWFHEGQNIPPHDEIQISNTMGLTCLTLSKITYEKSGKYIIYIENAIGSDSKYVNVTVEGSSNVVAPGSYLSVSENFEPQITNISNRMDTSGIKNEDRDGEDFEYGEVMPINIFKDRYDILEEIGKGRYGVVRKIIDKSTKTHLAAKFVRTIKGKDREQVLKEVSIMSTMEHPKLLRLITAFGGSKEMIMVTEYISGGELFERVVADDFTLTEKDSVLFVRQICEGVAYMHDKYIVHMDLKPENIMCQTRTCHRIKLIDFGLAQTLAPDTPVRVLFGTPEFISPEIIDFEPIGTESDMWSIGVICYVLLTGLSPFMGDSDAETFVNITRADYDFDDVAFDAISKEAIDFISSLLIKKKELRLSATDCLTHPWLTQSAEQMSQVILSTDKLKNFIVRRKWQKTGNAIRALGRMANLSAKSRKNVLTKAVSEEVEDVHSSFEDSSQDNQEHSGIDELSQSSMEPLTADLSELTSHYSEIHCYTEVNNDETQLDNDFDMKTCDEMDCLSEGEEISDKNENIPSMENTELRTDSQEKLNSVLDDEKYNSSFFNHFSNIQIYQPIVKNLGERFEKCETRDIDNLIHRGTPEIIKSDRKMPVLSKNVFVIRNNDFLNKESTQSQCETNKLQLDEEDGKGEIPRITSIMSPLHHVRTGNVSRTAKLFEKEDVSSVSPTSRSNLPATRPKNERIRKAFEFWNK